MAEGVAAAIEVKSDLAKQWGDVVETARKLNAIRRQDGGGTFLNAPMAQMERIPIFAVGYSGWKTREPLVSPIGHGDVDGILIIDPGLFVSRQMQATGPWALWGLINCLHAAVHARQQAAVSPLWYAVGMPPRGNRRQLPTRGSPA